MLQPLVAIVAIRSQLGGALEDLCAAYVTIPQIRGVRQLAVVESRDVEGVVVSRQRQFLNSDQILLCYVFVLFFLNC